MGAAISGPSDAPVMTTELGRPRSRAGNQVCTIRLARAGAGPSAKPSVARHAMSTTRPTLPASGTRLRHHSSMSPATSQRARIRSLSPPTVIAPTANSQKKLLWTSPNSCSPRPRSRLISTPASPVTALSAKLISMKSRNRTVTVQPRLRVARTSRRAPGPRAGAAWLSSAMGPPRGWG
nr:hypothetical protein [Actinomadura sp. J1-007]